MIETSFYLSSPYNIYCEKITPDKISKDLAIVMVPGVAHTGSCYKVKPDGNRGWAYFFAAKGFEVYVLDWPGMGRSGYVPFKQINGEFMVKGLAELLTKKINKKVILFTHSMSGAYGWKLAENVGDKIKYLVAVAPAEMGNIQNRPTILKKTDNNFSIQMAWGVLNINLTEWVVNDRSFIEKKLIGQSKLFPVNHLREYISSLQWHHPVLTYERLNINGSQLKINNFSKLKDVKVLIVNGTNDADHPREAKMKIINYLNDHKVSAELLWLGDKGIVGNGHMMMLEKNSDDIANLIYRKILV